MGGQSVQLVKYSTVINTSVVDNSHTQIISHINSGARVLDVGCASGILGEFLVRERNCSVVGLDFDEAALTLARKRNCYENLIQADLNVFDVGRLVEGKKFDFVVFGDVLEHLLDPAKFLQSLKPLLLENGKFVVSLPNVSHGSLKFNLLNNVFEYTEEGLLDSTHLKLFTKNSIKEFCVRCGLNINSFRRVFAPIYSMEQAVNKEEFPPAIVEYIESDLESWVYQYVFTASCMPNESADIDELLCPSEEELGRFRRYKQSNSNPKKKRFKDRVKGWRKLYGRS